AGGLAASDQISQRHLRGGARAVCPAWPAADVGGGVELHHSGGGHRAVRQAGRHPSFTETLNNGTTRVQFGLNFFPCVVPDEKPAARYFREAMHLCSLTDELGYTHIRQVEHYFKPYGGYSPNPLIFLTAAAMRTKNTRLITGAVLPAFNRPLKLAGEIGMLDGISAGRLEVGFARAFLPHEFAQFGVSLDESRRRFAEGLAQITLLLKEENVSAKGEFNSFS